MQLVRGKKLISEQALPLPLPLPLSPPGPSLPSPAAKKFALQRLPFWRRLYIWEKIGYNRTAR